MALAIKEKKLFAAAVLLLHLDLWLLLHLLLLLLADPAA